MNGPIALRTGRCGRLGAHAGAAAHDRYSVIGVFTSRAGALRFLAEDVIGIDVARQIAWGCSPDDPYYREGAGPDERRCILVLEFVDGPYQLSH